MKRMMILAVAAAFAGVMMVGCGSSKQQVQQRVSDEQRAKIDANTEQYRKEIKN
ncbi:hypothetical protein AGMMS49965_13690 [Bacteroidia bacterium]|nr:hypothetical protein AGMMS49965_13690 [Bacteroidia bacterium]